LFAKNTWSKFTLFLLAGALCLAALVMHSNPAVSSETSTGGKTVLTFLTYNLWHGLNPVGYAKFEEYETPAGREDRLQGFLAQARALDPDVIFLQEVNPAPVLAKRIAKELGYDYVAIVDNAGLKIGSVGMPSNLRSGLAIVARKNLNLKGLGHKKLSGGQGRASAFFSIQLSEFRYAHAAQITVNGKDVLLVNTHLHHGLEVTADLELAMGELVAKGTISQEYSDEAIRTGKGATKRRQGELKNAIALAKSVGMMNRPMLFAGDFNASPDAKELMWLKNDLGFVSVTKDDDPATRIYTWDPDKNQNSHLAAEFKPANEYEEFLKQYLVKRVVLTQRRLDYIFYRNVTDNIQVIESGLFGDTPYKEKMASDHFGIWAKVEIGE
jgi:endonuclease/exonuclease/phosphatase family metal-dependent hydrolase